MTGLQMNHIKLLRAYDYYYETTMIPKESPRISEKRQCIVHSGGLRQSRHPLFMLGFQPHNYAFQQAATVAG